MNVLITGGAGFIGSHLSDFILSQGHVVYVIDDLSTGSMSNIAHLENHPRFHYSISSVLEKEKTAEFVSKCDQIYHLAASVGVKLVVQEPLESFRNNTETTELILNLASKHNAKVLITSSSEVYGKNDNLPFKEEDDRIFGSAMDVRWGYALSKAIDEFSALGFHNQFGLPVIVVRLFNTVGPRQKGHYGMVIPRFVEQALRNQDLVVHGTGTQRRCFTDVSDVVLGLASLMQSDDAVGKIFNIGSTNEISIVELAEKIIGKLNSSSSISFADYRDVYGVDFEDMQRRIPNLDRINEIIGYVAAVDLDQCIDNVAAFYMKNGNNGAEFNS